MGTVEGIDKSGINQAALVTNETKQIIEIGTNQAFQATEIVIANGNASEYAQVRIFDEAATTSAPTAASQKIPDIWVAPQETVRLPLDGVKFYNEVSAEAEGGTGTVEAYAGCMVSGKIF